VEMNEVLNRARFEKVIADVALKSVTHRTIIVATALLETEYGDWDFINRVAGIPEDADLKEAAEVALEGLVYDLKVQYDNTGA
jgi:hypothetical protein